MAKVFVKLGPPAESSFANPLRLLSECHRRIERFLSDMTRVAVERRGGQLTAADREALAGAVRYFKEAAPRHTADEEQSLFPRLRSAGGQQISEALGELSRLESDHQHADACHAEANSLADRWLADDALNSTAAQRLIALLETLQSVYRDHIAIEDSAVFPAAAAVLPAEQLESMVERWPLAAASTSTAWRATS